MYYLRRVSTRRQIPEWHSRGYVPHWERDDVAQSITFRLYDSIPQDVYSQLAIELASLPESARALERRRRIEEALDLNLGARHLEHPEIAGLVERSLLYFDGNRYRLHAWVVMPTHVHVVLSLGANVTLGSIVHSWKSFSAKAANGLLGRTGPFWLGEYFDRAIRDELHFAAAVDYTEMNPVKARLCVEKSEWPWSSAAPRWAGSRR
ncbi:MAG: transposase [Deltaproteobacteria bacterium]|nr:transposase [Deltaproteobacteria bacterium]